MTMLSWFRSPRKPVTPDPEQESEKKALQAELAQVVMTFGRRRTTVQQIAEQAVQSMREGQR